MLIVKNGYLIAEKYFNGKNVQDANPIASATKSFNSAVVGLAIKENIIESLDQRLMVLFPEFEDSSYDPRKDDITLYHMLTLQTGFPDDSRSPYIEQLQNSNDWRWFLLDWPLVTNPGTKWAYSNLCASLLLEVLLRISNFSIPAFIDFAETGLFAPIGIEIKGWPYDEFYLTAREMALFGQLYLNIGKSHNEQVLSATWIEDSFKQHAVTTHITYGDYFVNCKYGYLWWQANCGVWEVHYAAGHGGQIIALVPELNVIVISSADSKDYGPSSWNKEKAMFNLVGRFISSIAD